MIAGAGRMTGERGPWYLLCATDVADGGALMGSKKETQGKWQWDPEMPDSVALLRQSRGPLHADEPLEDLGPEELRERLIEDAQDYIMRYPAPPPMEEVVDEIVRHRFRPADMGLPDSTTLLRRERER
jgi:hypothetical protein